DVQLTVWEPPDRHALEPTSRAQCEALIAGQHQCDRSRSRTPRPGGQRICPRPRRSRRIADADGHLFTLRGDRGSQWRCRRACLADCRQAAPATNPPMSALIALIVTTLISHL